MVIHLKTAFLIVLGILVIWFLYLEKEILSPFIIAAIFAYVFNPIVGFLHSKIKLPRVLSIILVWIVIILVVGIFGVWLIRGAIAESVALQRYIHDWASIAKGQLDLLPSFARPALAETLSSLQKTLFVSSISLLSIFPQALSGVVGFFIFLLSSFYFLKEGRNIFDKILLVVPKDYRIEAEILIRKVNLVLGDYLRGQFLVVIISFSLFFVLLTIMGVKFALILAVISGFLEVIPLLGPPTGALITVLVILVTGVSNFNLNPLQAAAIIVVVTFIIRQFLDYLIIPRIMSKIVKLHPLLVIFAVLSGGRLAGVLGLILAVPIAAVVRIIFEFFLDKVNEKEYQTTNKNV